jgi:hypothetical protein
MDKFQMTKNNLNILFCQNNQRLFFDNLEIRLYYLKLHIKQF